MTGLSQALGSAVSPAVYVVPCVRFNCFVRLSFTSSTVATLGMSGWLDLPQQGLSPCKKRQASLGALTFRDLSPERPYLILNATDATSVEDSEEGAFKLFTFTEEDFQKKLGEDHNPAAGRRSTHCRTFTVSNALAHQASSRWPVLVPILLASN